jgi:F-type H+-transporting ATPase subunit b
MEIEITRAVALISINATLVVQLISFLIFMMLISRLMYQPLQDIVAERDRQIELMEKEIAATEADLEEVFFTIESQMLQAKNDAFAAQHQLEKDAAKQADALFEGVTAEISRLHEETKTEVQRQVQEVRQHLAEESERLSRIIMEKALDRRMANE